MKLSGDSAKIMFGAMISFISMWLWCGVACAQINQNNTMEGAVSQEKIYVSITIYITSLIATVAFVWAIASYYHGNKRRFEKGEERFQELTEQITELKKIIKGEDEKPDG